MAHPTRAVADMTLCHHLPETYRLTATKTLLKQLG